MKLLIAGIPGTGKTTIGEYLESHKGYEHFDVEKAPWTDTGICLPYLKEFCRSPGQNKVITWGFVPGRDDAVVMYLCNAGFKFIWFDGSVEAARKAFLKRGNVPEYLFNLQIRRIEAADINAYNPILVDPFTPDGQFVEKEVIVSAILAKCS